MVIIYELVFENSYFKESKFINDLEVLKEQLT